MPKNVDEREEICKKLGITGQELEDLFEKAMTPEQRADIEKMMRGESIGGVVIDVDTLEVVEESKDDE